ncbi:rhomboid family intramembrane serine protease [Marinicella sp. W31]|uniref:rhomboid family intramembrane serine protease n=1 Tax=Marinicella sp. W31 TaxID=3023713 RepID=UPI003756D1B6
MKIPQLDPNYAKLRRKQWPRAFRIGLAAVGVIWLVFLLDLLLPLSNYGVRPRTVDGLIGIISMPFLHSGLAHIVNNSLPLMIAMTALYGNYPKTATKTVILSTLFSGALVWLLAREVNHIGSSGLFYALLSYLFASGFFKKDIQSIGISLAIAFLYGGMLYGLIPEDNGISWEAHLYGFLVGLALAWKDRDRDKPKLKEWNWDEEEEEAV